MPDGVTAPVAQGPFDPGADEAHLVVEPDAPLELELLDLRFDLLADAVALLLEPPDLALDLAFDDGFPELEEANVPSDLFLKLLQRRQCHGIPHDKFLTFLKHPGVKDQRPVRPRPTR